MTGPVPESKGTSMGQLQEEVFSSASAYASGSPHLMHARLRDRMIDELRRVVLGRLNATGRCRVLEVGAGHGSFTDHVLAAGATMTITEMSRPSLDELKERYRYNGGVTLVYDNDGEAVFKLDQQYDVVLCISVLHHIIDYVSFIDRVTERIDAGGAFVCFQDPLYYPRRSSAALRADRAAFLSWRIRQGELRRGLATQLRRFRGRYEDRRPEDTVEYHAVRQGVDEEAILDVLRERFGGIELVQYWSTPGMILQGIGTRMGLSNTFGIVATQRLPAVIQRT